MARAGPAAALSRAFGAWGAVAGGRLGVISCVLAAALAAVLAAGIHRARFFDGITDQWAAQTPALKRNRAVYNEAFGGIEREAVVAVSAKDRGSVLSREHLLALKNLSETLSNAKLDGASQQDFCSRPEVPALMRPTNTTRGFAVSGTFFSWGYAAITRCLVADRELYPEALNGLDGLPENWGIKRMPCSRGSALDCFREGSYDYPQELQLLDVFAGAVVNVSQNKPAAMTKCSTPVLNAYIQRLPEITPQEQLSDIPQIAGVLHTNLLKGIVLQFASWGYNYRPQLAAMRTDADVKNYLVQALRNARNPAFNKESCYVPGTPCCLAWSGVATEAESAFGDLQFDKPGDVNSSVVDARAMRTAYTHYNENDQRWGRTLQTLLPGVTTTAQRLNASEALEQRIIDALLPRFNSRSGSGFGRNERFASSAADFYLRRSSDDILTASRGTPVGLVVGGYAILVVYVVLALVNYSRPFGATNAVLARVALGLAGLLVLSLGTVAGFGLMGWAGVRLSPTSTNVLPFIALGIGIDDMFMIALTLLARADLAHRPVDRMRAVLENVGPSVLLTSLSLTIGFLIASVVRIPGVYSFTYQLAATIAINFVLLIAMFVPICAWDCFRVARKNADLLPCIPCAGRVTHDAEEEDGRTFEEARQGATFGAQLARFADRVLGPKALFAGIKGSIAVVVLAVLFTAGMLAAGIVLAKPGLPLDGVALDGTYQNSFLALQERAFPLQTSYVVHEATSASAMAAPDAQKAMIAQAQAVQGAFGTSDRPPIAETSWLYGNLAALLPLFNAPRGKTVFDTVPLDRYYGNLAEWLVSGGGSSLVDEVRCTDRTNGTLKDVACAPPGSIPQVLATTVAVRASRMRFVQRGLRTTADFVKAITATRKAIREAPKAENVRAFVHGYMYELWLQYVTIFTALYKVVGFTLLGVAIVAALLLPPAVAAIMVVTLVALCVQLFGMCMVIGVQVNAISVTNFAVGISMGVEFAAHYAHAFASHGDDALRRTLPAVTAGALSTVLALLPMVGTRFPFVRLYYYGAWTLMTVLAFLNGALLLPAVLHLLPGSTGKAKSISEASADVESVPSDPQKAGETVADGDGGGATAV